jgi:hypothetical protein
MPENKADSTPSSPSDWASYGTTDKDENFIVGSPEGLRELRDHIDKAIAEGESFISNTHIQFNGVRCRTSPEDEPSDSGNSLATWGCLFILGTILFLAVMGAISLYKMGSELWR